MRKYLFLSFISYIYITNPLFAIRDAAMNSFSAPGLNKNAQIYTDAQAEATHFLALIDQEQYNSAWSDSGPIMRAIIPMEIWVEGVRFFRHPLGIVTARRVVSHEQFSSLPGGISGNFYRINYRTEFNGLRPKNEALVLSAEGLGRWRVISYSFH